MTREAVVEGYERFLGDAIEQTVTEFDLSRALRGVVSAPGTGAIDKLVKRSGPIRQNVVEPELNTYRKRALDQFDIILEYVESDADIETYRAALLEAGAFENELREDLPEKRREEVVSYMLSRYARFGDALAPLISSPETEFWNAAVAELTVAEAHDLVEEQFRYTKPLREYPDAFRMTVRINPTDVFGPFGALMGAIRIEYTEEAIRATAAAEEIIIEETKVEIDDRFGV